VALWHYDYDVKMTEALFFQFMGQHCFSGGVLLTAWLDDRRPIGGMVCEDISAAGQGDYWKVHLITCLRPRTDDERALLLEGCRAGLDYAFKKMGALSLMSFIPVINRGALKLVDELGFRRRLIRDCCYVDRLKRSTDGYLVSMERS
jgi:RimJ/RimL family protein N-acetyltransferase